MSQPASKRLLLVTSGWAPTMIADLHRARHLAWELPKLGWQVDVLAPGQDFQPKEYIDRESYPLFNPQVECFEVPPSGSPVYGWLGMRSMSWKSLLPLYREGCRLMAARHYDLIYITTAKFNLFLLGSRWKRRFHSPYLLDFHDPWVKQENKYVTTSSSWKRSVSRILARPLQRIAVRSSAGLVAVSQEYIDDLRTMYPRYLATQPERTRVIPFSAREQDFGLPAGQVQEEVGPKDIVYVGAGGDIMLRSFDQIVRTFQRVASESPNLAKGIRFRFYGTYAYWKPGDRKQFEDAANRLGMKDQVIEEPAWIGYVRSLRLAKAAGGLAVLGVDDRGYIPSKLFSYAATGKPLLACFRFDAPAAGLFQSNPDLGHLLTFGDATYAGNMTAMRRFLEQVQQGESVPRNSWLKPYLAPAMAAAHIDLFNSCLNPAT